MNYNLDEKVIFQLFCAATNKSLAHNYLQTMLCFAIVTSVHFSHELNFQLKTSIYFGQIGKIRLD